MALYTISDLHLPLGVDKPMDIFGKSWENYVERLHDNWQSTIKDDDIVVLPGDFSWATYIEDAKRDFEFLNNLNGQKILLKGNHDYWWETMSKMKRFVAENKYSTIEFLQNNSFIYNDIAICGTRGWTLPVSPNLSEDDKKIYQREVQRLELSLLSAKNVSQRVVFTHYPPIGADSKENDFTNMMKKHDVRLCIYGHLHAGSSKNALIGSYDSIDYLLVSCDYLKFNPIKLFD